MALVPPARLKGKKVLSLVFILGERTMATQSTEGQFTAGFREVAKTLGVIFSPILSVTGGVKCSHDGRGQMQPPRVGRLVMKEG